MADVGISSEGKLRDAIRLGGLLLGPTAGLALFFQLPQEYRAADGSLTEFTTAGRATLAVMCWMACWWLSEAVDITVTALIPVTFFPLLGVGALSATAANYAHPLIFLFMGGFLLAISMQHWGLGRRIALLTLRLVGTRPTRMVAGFMLVTAVLSAFVSNTATTAMMLPIALSLVALVQGRARAPGGEPSAEEAAGEKNFALCLMLGIAYAASIGGVATIIGTPPNVFLVGFLRDTIEPQYRMQVSFAGWMLIGVPLAAIFLPLVWLLLTRLLYPIRGISIPGGQELIRRELQSLGTANRGEWATLLVFCLAATLWITQPLLAAVELTWDGETIRPLRNLSDPGIAMGAAMLLFVIPSGRGGGQRFVLVWENAKGLPWGILLLFGGGLALADAVAANGVAEFFGAQAARFAGVPTVVLVLLVAAGIIFLTELTSNTATTATLLPVLAALAPGLGVHPYLLVFPAAIAASCAFMLPVATPPNAIVFASGQVTIPQMAKAGLWLNLLGVLLITLLTYVIIVPLLGLDW